jgi:DNA-binding NarL/FixJ family response regulator
MMISAQEEATIVSVLVVDDQRIICEGIASLLSLQPGIRVVGMASNGEEALMLTENLQPDVVLMDVRMPVMDGIRATQAIRESYQTCQVLILTTFDDDAYILQALQAGAVGYLLKDIPAADLAQAIQAAHRRIYMFDRTIAGKVVAALRDSDRVKRPTEPVTHSVQPNELSSRELEVVRLLAQGASNREIAQQLVVSEGTVKTHISNILGRLGVRDRTQAALLARERGWV